jgi:thiol:disulfide interchange protein
MKTRPVLTTIAVILAGVGDSCGGSEVGPIDPGAVAVASHDAVEIEWSRSWDAAFERARAEDKAVLVTFYADWCIWCKRLEDTTLADGRVAAFMADTVVPLRLDVDGDGGQLASRFEVDGLPTILVLDDDGRELGRIPGYLPPGGFLERVRALLG